MTGIIVEVVALHTLAAFHAIDTCDALVTMEVEAVMALPITDLIVMRLALLLFECHEGRHHEETSNQACNEPKSDHVFNAHVSGVFYALLQVYSLVHVASEHAQFEKKP